MSLSPELHALMFDLANRSAAQSFLLAAGATPQQIAQAFNLPEQMIARECKEAAERFGLCAWSSEELPYARMVRTYAMLRCRVGQRQLAVDEHSRALYVYLLERVLVLDRIVRENEQFFAHIASVDFDIPPEDTEALFEEYSAWVTRPKTRGGSGGSTNAVASSSA